MQVWNALDGAIGLTLILYSIAILPFVIMYLYAIVVNSLRRNK